ncbi:hypothetical protein DPMN_067192 [Dreissena polymorpha]|uniref:Uncharacterized protein n=1 Tax=Dreissena polymorpha TaxID=45954 RepID=A0A9D4BTE9_DREPO|nr:hypothetical protein DPMN_067192 [Dreissena polymorpha]
MFGSEYPDAGLKEIHLVIKHEKNTGLTVAHLREIIRQGSLHLLEREREREGGREGGRDGMSKGGR